jgi:hypothetical protein
MKKNFVTAMMANIFAFSFMMMAVAIYSWAQHGYISWIMVALAVGLIRQTQNTVLTTPMERTVYDSQDNKIYHRITS